jgi:hypothetical protein
MTHGREHARINIDTLCHPSSLVRTVIGEARSVRTSDVYPSPGSGSIGGPARGYDRMLEVML